MYPYPADMNKMKRKKQEEITIELEEVILDEHLIKQLSNKHPNSGVSKNVNPPPEEPNISIDQNLQGTHNTLTPPKNTQNSFPPPDEKNSSKVNMNYPLRMKSIEDEALANLDE